MYVVNETRSSIESRAPVWKTGTCGNDVRPF